jgi:hypothetical protein
MRVQAQSQTVKWRQLQQQSPAQGQIFRKKQARSIHRNIPQNNRHGQILIPTVNDQFGAHL